MFGQTDFSWVTNQGLAVGLLIAIGLGTWRVISWMGGNVILPMKDSAIHHLNEVNRTMEVNSQATSALTNMIATLHNDVKDIKTGGNCKYKRDL